MADVSFSVDVVMNLIDNTKSKIQKTHQEMDQLFAAMDKVSKTPVKVDQGLTDVERTQKQVAVLQTYAKTLVSIERIYGKGSAEANAYFSQVTKGSKSMEKQLSSAKKVAEGFSFSFLSLIFGGQALSRTFGDTFKKLKENYNQLADKNNEFAKGTQRVSDSFTLLKFNLFNAFANNPIVLKSIDRLTEGLIKLADWVDDNPGLAATITGIFGALGLVGIGLTGIGTFQQLFMNGGTMENAVKALSGLKTILTFDLINGTKRFFTNLSNIRAPSASALSGITDLLQITGKNAQKFTTLKAAVGVGLVLSTIDIITKDGNSMGARIFNTAGFAIAGAWIGNAIFPGLGAAIGGAIGAAVGVVININDVRLEKKQLTKARQVKRDLQTLINEAASEGLRIDTGTLTTAVERSLLAIDNKDLINSFKGLKEDFALGIIPDEETYRNRLMGLTGTVDKANSAFAVATADSLKKQFDLTPGQKTLLFDIKTDFSPIQLDYNDFAGQMITQSTNITDAFGGITTEVGNTLTETDGYVQYIPTLTLALDNEGEKVDILTTKYNALAKAKAKAKKGDSNAGDVVTFGAPYAPLSGG